MRRVGVVLGAVLAASLGLAVEPGFAAGADQLFAENCAACHQAAGQGIKGAFPALAGDAFVQGDPGQAAFVVLNGRGGMPTFAPDLSDDQIAQILTYVRSSWGNKASPVTSAMVAAARLKSKPDDARSALQAH
ncbi:MAG TPA: cytochrome c [Caulobacteraceae bacterium]|jgi:mono/diheme cytochrome c family protein